MDNLSTNLLIGLLIFLLLGVVSMRAYFRWIDPWLRARLGRLLGVEIRLGEQNIWQINDESVDSLNWRNLFVRPAQMLALLFAGLLPLVLTVAIVQTLAGR